MVNICKNYIVILFSFSLLISNSNFTIKNNSLGKFELGLGDVIDKIDNLKSQLSSNQISFEETILPSYSTFYQIKDGLDIDVFYTSENISVDFLDDKSKNKIINNINSQDQYFPQSNLIVSDYMFLEG